jgi:protein TonB
MTLWLRPYYTLDWGRTEMEGTIVLSLRIRPTGDTYEIATERSSGSEKLDAAALLAAKSWRFTPARWQGGPIESQVIVELTFRFFEYSVTRIDEATFAGASKRDSSGTALQDRSAMIRKLVEQLRSGDPAEPDVPRYTNESPQLGGEMRDWGPVTGVQFLGSIGTPQWRRYDKQPKFQSTVGSNSVAVRWELYRVAYDDKAALWEVAIDRKGGVWAMKAELLDESERAAKAVVTCPGSPLSKD